MRRREQREHIFKLLFMTHFNSQEEMSDQFSFYFEGLGLEEPVELDEKDVSYMKEKYENIFLFVRSC